jgi:hypothetical protein
MRLICYVCLIVGAVLLFADRIDRRGGIRNIRKDSSEMTNGPALSAISYCQKYFYFQDS